MNTITSFIKKYFWKTVAVIILSAGGYSIYLRFTEGLGAATNLSDEFPWGLWIGFDILSGVGLAAGGFTLCAIVYIFNIKKFKPIIRPTILTAFLGYLLVIFALLFDLGRPWAIWHALVMWNPRSVMFEVAWCVMLYTTVLFLEFSPVILEKYNLPLLTKVLKSISIPLVVAGVLLSTLHQSSLGSLYLIVPAKMHPLWYSNLLPIYFYLSAIGVGCAMVIFESFLSAKAFKKQLEFSLVSEIGRWIVVALSIYFTVKLMDLISSDKIKYLFDGSFEANLFLLEMILGVVIPVALLMFHKIRTNRVWLFICASSVIGGFLLNRMNVSITSIQAFATADYFPSVFEIMITLFIITLGVIIFNITARNFNLFPEETHSVKKIVADFQVVTEKKRTITNLVTENKS